LMHTFFRQTARSRGNKGGLFCNITKLQASNLGAKKPADQMLRI